MTWFMRWGSPSLVNGDSDFEIQNVRFGVYMGGFPIPIIRILNFGVYIELHLLKETAFCRDWGLSCVFRKQALGGGLRVQIWGLDVEIILSC